ncbi:trimethylamine monooxygenase [Microdochium nivale]|nr:trimethylamine monooxygenase [Microdochium nivale]
MSPYLSSTTQEIGAGSNNDTTARRIAIIGAGISGIATAAHLLRHNRHRHQFDVTVFERSDFVGGVWEYDARTPPEPEYPSDVPPDANDPVRQPVQDAEEEDYDTAALAHAPPGPAYKGLKNNVPTSLMYSALQAWPEGTEEFVDRELIARYLRDLSDSTGARDCVVLNTSVESIWKDAVEDGKAAEDKRERDDVPGDNDIYRGKWSVRTKTLVKQDQHNGTTTKPSPASEDGPAAEERRPLFTHATHTFDAVVVASGHYHVPRVPDLPGLQAWREAHPGSVSHAKAYRTPDRFPGDKVLVVGSSASSHDIAKELAQAGKTVYVSSRGGQWDIGAPEPAVRVGEILEFVPRQDRQVRLRDGTVLQNIDHVVLATGYLTSYPFLGRRLQDPAVHAGQAGDETVVTRDGLLTHNLHRDVWYIPDPSLAFVGVVFHTSTFSMFDFQAAVVARVLAGQAELPAREAMREEYVERKRRVLPGIEGGGDGDDQQQEQQHLQSLRSFHSLMGRETVYVADMLGWVNADAHRLGVPEMSGFRKEWHRRYEEFREQIKARRAALGGAPTGGVVFGPLGRLQREEEMAEQSRSGSLKHTQVAETEANVREEAHKRLRSEAGQAVKVFH